MVVPTYIDRSNDGNNLGRTVKAVMMGAIFLLPHWAQSWLVPSCSLHFFWPRGIAGVIVVRFIYFSAAKGLGKARQLTFDYLLIYLGSRSVSYRCASERVHCFENNGFSGLGGWLCFKNPPYRRFDHRLLEGFFLPLPFQALLLQDLHLYFFLHPSLPQSGFLNCKVYRSTVCYLHVIYLSCRVFPLSDPAVAIAGWF